MSMRTLRALCGASLVGLGVFAADTEAASGWLRVSSSPAGAEILVDGAPTGRFTPAWIVLEEGPRAITLRLPSDAWEPATETVIIAPGRNALSVVLAPELTDGASCWDLDEDRRCDLAAEDRDGDGRCTVADCQGLPGRDGSSCSVVQEVDGATLQCEDGTSARVFDGLPGPPGGGDALEELSALLGIARSDLSVPPQAIQPADCSAAGSLLDVGGAPLGELVGLFGREAISEPPRFVGAVRIPGGSLDPGTLVGQAARIVVDARGGALVFSGRVTRAALAAWSPDGATYVLDVESSLALLERNRGFSVYADQKIPDILRNVFGRSGVASRFSLAGATPVLEFQIQHDESDLDFVTRLMSEAGMHFVVEENGVVRVSDENGTFTAGPALLYRGHFAPAPPAEAAASSFRAARALVSRTMTVAGFDPAIPAAFLGTATGFDGVGEDFTFLARLSDQQAAEQEARLALERAALTREAGGGTSNSPGVRAGTIVTIAGAGAPFAGDYLVTGVTHALTPAAGPCFGYGNRFEVVPAALPFRPPSSPSRRLESVLTGIVTEVDTSNGRIRVRFPWDRDGEGASAWVRLSYPLGRGSELFRPELDDEVVVGFVQGDLSRPIVLGGLWNGANPPPSQ